MRKAMMALAASAVLPAGAAPAALGRSSGASAARASLRRALAINLQASGPNSGAYVVDLSTGQPLFSASARVGRLPASVEKVYTTSTALLLWGPAQRFRTEVLGEGQLTAGGAWNGTLYVHGGGDPSFGQAAFDHSWYGGGATMQRLVADLIATTGITSLNGAVVGDESYFDSLRGTAPYGYNASTEIEGELSALAYDRGFSDVSGATVQADPPLVAAQQFVLALRAAGVKVHQGTPTSAGAAPAGLPMVASVDSPSLATLIDLTNTPSDNFFAEMLLKGLGASFGGAGTSAAGAAVVRSEMAKFGAHPKVVDGSGLSRRDITSPVQVVTVLEHMASNPDFVQSLAVAGRTGTLQHRMAGTAAAGRCDAKTGTLLDASTLAGYCTARDGHTLAFAFMMNQVDPASVHPLQDAMAAALARYNG
jgi:D-alanyl-D-alanine carboxypeptidase/D-alanyl-D-alanine-endopeptidase (penicillin-binding protein 4)